MGGMTPYEQGGVAGPRDQTMPAAPGTGTIDASGTGTAGAVGMHIDPVTGKAVSTGGLPEQSPPWAKGQGGATTLAPGQNGMWDLTHAGGLAQPMAFPALLEALRTRFGGGSAMGSGLAPPKAVGATVGPSAPSRATPQTPSAQPRMLLGGLRGR